MTYIDTALLDVRAAYRFLSGAVVPRPIAWVLSGAAEDLNLAPFSCFTFVSYAPMLLGINCGRRNGELKDTAYFVRESGEFVVHIPSEKDLPAVQQSSAPLARGHSELSALKLKTTPSVKLSIPRLVGPLIAMECRLSQIVPFGRLGSEFLVGEVVAMHIDEGLLREGKYIETEDLRPLSRIAGPNYAFIGTTVGATVLDATLAIPE